MTDSHGGERPREPYPVAMRRPILRPALTAHGPISADISSSITCAATALTASRITAACSSSSTFLTTSSIVILSAPATAGASYLRRTLRSPPMMSAGVAGTSFSAVPSDPLLRMKGRANA